MAKNTVYFLVSFKINEGRFDALKEIAQAMIAFTQKESGSLAYEWYFSPDKTKGRLFETYADQNAVAAHMEGRAVQELVPKIRELSSITGFEVYGDPGSKAAEILSKIGAEIFQHWNGLGR
ncbi:MAG TPA: antibiotic biosynthesis monooxygenase [Terriglobales bacterium]